LLFKFYSKIIFFQFKNKSSEMNISIVIAQEAHFKYAQIICDTIEQSALMRGTELPNVHLNTSKKNGK
jgi:hypothetical protein